ncbi:MAG: hypothetical protein ACFFCD_08180 [Promethearchaeota archaeon]
MEYSPHKIVELTNEYLERRFGNHFRITIETTLDLLKMSAIQLIDTKNFRKELRYSVEEFIERTKQPDFYCLLIYNQALLVAFLFGYRDESLDDAFYLDTIASILQRKGIGTLLLHCALVICYLMDFRCMTLRTELTDEKGQHPFEFFKKNGFYQFECPPEEGIAMKKELTDYEIVTYLDMLKK